MAKKVIATERAPKAIGPYAQGWAVDKMVFTSGQKLRTSGEAAHGRTSRNRMHRCKVLTA
ncbi:hypothetical protein [Bariatricus massiliensis]